MKIAVYYDSLLGKGGAERVVIQLANHLNADIITSGYNPEIQDWMPIKGNVIDLGNFSMKFFKPVGILFEAPLRYLFSRKKLDYDLHIFCGFTSLYGAKKNNLNVWRSFTPNRIMYDLQKEKQKNTSFMKAIAFKLHVLLFKQLDQRIVKTRFAQIFVQSQNVQKRVKQYYDMHATLIYDPVDTRAYYFKKFGDFYLAVSRLFPEKRISTIVDAFVDMPDKQLVIVGDGPEKEMLLEKIEQTKNIQLLSNATEKELLTLYAECLATIYLPKNEDYGLIPLESMAAGKPCIAANEGGCKETVKNNETGFLITANKKELQKTINAFDASQAKQMKRACIEQAKKFDVTKAFKQWDYEITKLVS